VLHVSLAVARFDEVLVPGLAPRAGRPGVWSTRRRLPEDRDVPSQVVVRPSAGQKIRHDAADVARGDRLVPRFVLRALRILRT
jgi:hypothetical protein